MAFVPVRNGGFALHELRWSSRDFATLAWAQYQFAHNTTPGSLLCFSETSSQDCLGSLFRLSRGKLCLCYDSHSWLPFTREQSSVLTSPNDCKTTHVQCMRQSCRYTRRRARGRTDTATLWLRSEHAILFSRHFSCSRLPVCKLFSYFYNSHVEWSTSSFSMCIDHSTTVRFSCTFYSSSSLKNYEFHCLSTPTRTCTEQSAAWIQVA